MARLEWFVRYGGDSDKNLGDVAGDTNTFLLVGDSDLIQDTDFWQGGFFYINDSLGNDNERVILNSSSDGKLVLEWSLPASDSEPTTAATYEIWDLWAPSMVHQAMNQAIRHAWRFFPNIVEAEQHIITEGRLEYPLDSTGFNDNGDPGTNMFPLVSEVLQVWIENSRSSQFGQVTSTTSVVAFTDTLNIYTTDSDGTVVTTDFLISVYDGPGAGQLRQLNTQDTLGVFTVDTDWTVDLDTNSRFRFWDPSTGHEDDWYRVYGVQFDQPENPDRLYLLKHYPAANGMRVRVKYEAQSTDFAMDTDESAVPEEYIVYKSLSILYDGLVGENRVDRSAHAGLAEYYDQLAEKFIRDNGRRLPGATLWAEEDVGSYSGNQDEANPLDWNWG